MTLDWLFHHDNLETKIRANYKSRGKDFEAFRDALYLPYQKAQLSISSIIKESILEKVRLLEKYYHRADRFNSGNWITFQSKFRPTILEEFCGYLFKDVPQVERLGLSFLKRDIYAGLDIDREGRARIKTKDVDFCIGKVVQATFNQRPVEIKIPVVAIECKTYIDNTMFSEAQFTAQKFKGGTPEVKVFVFAETNEIALDQIPSQSPIDQIYILRKDVGSAIDGETVWAFFQEVQGVLQRVSLGGLLTLPGKLLVYWPHSGGSSSSSSGSSPKASKWLPTQ